MAVMMFVSSYLQEGSLLKCDYFVIFVKRFQLLSFLHTLCQVYLLFEQKTADCQVVDTSLIPARSLSTSGNSEWARFSLACAIPGTFRNFAARTPVYVNSYFNITVKNWIARGSIV